MACRNCCDPMLPFLDFNVVSYLALVGAAVEAL